VVFFEKGGEKKNPHRVTTMRVLFSLNPIFKTPPSKKGGAGRIYVGVRFLTPTYEFGGGYL
jgi:hypothetical protein